MKLSKSLLLIPAASFLFAASVGAGACSSSASVGAPGGDVFENGVVIGTDCSGTVYVTGTTGFAYCSGGVWVYTDDESDIPTTDTLESPTGDDGGDDATSPDDAGDDATSPDAGDDATSPDAGDDATTPDDAGDDATSPDDAGDDAASPDAGSGDDAASPDAGS